MGKDALAASPCAAGSFGSLGCQVQSSREGILSLRAHPIPRKPAQEEPFVFYQGNLEGQRCPPEAVNSDSGQAP